jgi:phospholipid/cholesterol/gamma-HCH transport system substrate-binding protein
VRIPITTKAVVADRSPAGEQYIDFEPYAASRRYLQDGAVISPKQTIRPPSLAGLLDSVTAFANSISLPELRTVFNQLEIALGGSGPALGRLIDNGAQLIASLEAVEPATIDLLNNGGHILDTQAAHNGDLRTFSRSLHRLADTLREDSPQTTRLIQAAFHTTQQVGPLLEQDAGNVGMLLVNLITVGHLVVQRLPGLNALLVSLPSGLKVFAQAVHSKHVNFTLLTQAGNACKYPHTRRQQPYDSHRGPPITNGYCLHPTKGEQQRGAIYAPRPPGDSTAGPGPSGSAATRASTRPRRQRNLTAHSTSWMKVFTAGES